MNPQGISEVPVTSE